MRRPRRPDPLPLDFDAVPVVIAGTALWLLGLIATLAGIGRLRADGHLWWVPTCAAGFLLGVLGTYVTLRRRTALRGGSPPAVEQLPPPLG